MAHRDLPADPLLKRAAGREWARSLGRASGYAALFFAGGVVTVALLLLLFGRTIIDGYGRRSAERTFAAAYPGAALHIGELSYSVGANRLVAEAVTLGTTNATLKAARITLTGVHWVRGSWGTMPPAAVLAQAGIEATNLVVEFSQSRYEIRCARIRASVPRSELIAEAAELRTLVGDEAFFAAQAFRTTRFHLVVPECTVQGLAYGSLLLGDACRATSIHLSRPSFDVLVNSDKSRPPFVKSPLMIHEALAAILPLRIDTITITNGHLTYCERTQVGAAPGVLTFGAVDLTAEGIANRGQPAAAILVRGQGRFMNAGVLQVQMKLPVASPDLSLRYSGSLSAMDLNALDAYIEIAEHTRIKSGSVQEIAFDIEVNAGRARGRVRATYKDLHIAVLAADSVSAKGIGNQITSFLANVLKIRNANAPDASGATKEGVVSAVRAPEDEFLQFAWSALWGGIVDLISH
jgi:hypothetical protein